MTGRLIVVGVLVLLVAALSNRPQSNQGQSSRPPALGPAELITIVKHRWSTDDFGRARHTITLKNTGERTYKDVVINIHYYAKTGTYLSHRTETLYEFFVKDKPQSVTVEHYAPKDAATSRVTVISAD